MSARQENSPPSLRVRQIANHRAIRQYARTVPSSTDFTYPDESEDDGPQDGPPPARQRQPDEPSARDTHLLKEIFEWVGYGDGRQFNSQGTAAFARFLVVAFYLEIRGFENVSVAEIARNNGVKTRAGLNKHLRAFNERFGVFASEQRRKTHRREPRVSSFAKAFAAESEPTKKFAGPN